MKRLRQLALLSVGAGGGLLLAEACADPVGQALIDAGQTLMDAGMIDTGGLIRDAGQGIADAGSRIQEGGAGAQAQAGSFSRSGNRIEMRFKIQEGSDGSRYATGPQPFDTQLDVECWPQLAVDGKTRCIPLFSGFSVSTYYADAACKTRLALDTGASCDAPARFGHLYEIAGCLRTYRIYHLRGEHTGSIYQASDPSGCTVSTRLEGFRYFVVGPEIPSADFVELENAGYEKAE